MPPSAPEPSPSWPSGPPGRARPPRPPSPALGLLAALVLVVLGLVVGFFTGLQSMRLLLLGSLHVSVGAVAALVLNAGFGAAAAWALRSRDAALAPGAGWFVAVLLLMFLPTPGGDVIVPESGASATAFLVLGFVGIGLAGLAAGWLAPRRPRAGSGGGSATPTRGSRR